MYVCILCILCIMYVFCILCRYHNTTAYRLIISSHHHSAYYLKFIIKRSKLCLDFSLTCHLIHLLTVSLYNRQFPLNFLWWALTILSAWLMTERSRSLCMFQELLPIRIKRTGDIEDSKENQRNFWSFFKSLFKTKKTSNSTINLYSSKSPLNPK